MLLSQQTQSAALGHFQGFSTKFSWQFCKPVRAALQLLCSQMIRKLEEELLIKIKKRPNAAGCRSTCYGIINENVCSTCVTFDTLSRSFSNSGDDSERGHHMTTSPTMNFSALIVEEDRESEERKEPQLLKKLLHPAPSTSWKRLPPTHWPMLFGLYNISLSGGYVTILPPIQV